MTTDTTDLLSTALNDPNAGNDPYTALVGVGKKYKDNAALAKSRIEADNYIATLEQEKSDMRAELDKLSTAKPGEEAVKSLIERIEAATKQNGATPAGTLSREDIEKLVREGINVNDSERTKRTNYLLVNAELNNQFKGDATAASKHLSDRMTQLGMDAQTVKGLAETNPKVFKELFVPAPGARKPDNSMPASRTGVLPDVGGEERGASYYSKLRKELGHKYWEPAMQQQRFKDRERLGERFNTL